MDYLSLIEEEKEKKLHQQIFEFVIEHVSRTGKYKHAIREAAKMFYPDKFSENPRYAEKLAYENFRYAFRKYKKSFWNKAFGTSGTSFGTDSIDDRVEMNMGYYVENHSGPINDRSRFVKDSESNRRLFEFKKIAYAILGEIIKPKSRLTSYIEEYTRDQRVVEILESLEENIWYNGRKYIKLPKRAAALLYLVVYRIYTMHYGIGNKPEKLIRRFFEVTGYGPRDLEGEIKELVSVFYDWLLML